MGEFSDWGGMGLPGDPEALPDADVDTVGAGGDPYGGGDYAGVGEGADEAQTQGALPGGGDGQYSPFSPNGGIDVTDLWSTRAASRLASQLRIGPGGSVLDYSDAPNLGVSPMPPRGAYPRSMQGGNGVAAIVRSVRESTGLRVTAKSIVGLIVRYGFPAAARLTGLAAQQLLQLFMREKGVRHHRRGPGIYTISRKLRAAARLQATVARVLGRGGHAHRRRARAPFHTMRKHKRKAR